MGVDEAYGPSIILFTIGVKALTFPLTKTQIESTTKMQQIAPAAKQLQERYRDKDPARLNLELQKLYTENQVNPLAGCLPAFAQIPLFIGLYRSLLNLAKEDKLSESFLWLPSLEGPVADYQQGIGWLTEWVNGAPKLGWHDTACYLVLPVLLVISQFASTELLTPKSDDPQQQQSQAILKFLPLMIGWFSLSVPSGLGLYWLTNNIVTTATTLLIRQQVAPLELAGGAAGGAAVAEPPQSKGFGGRRYGEIIETTDANTGTKITIKPPTSVRDAAPAAPAAPAAGAGDDVVDAVIVDEHDDAAAKGTTQTSAAPPKKKKKGKKSKK